MGSRLRPRKPRGREALRWRGPNVGATVERLEAEWRWEAWRAGDVAGGTTDDRTNAVMAVLHFFPELDVDE